MVKALIIGVSGQDGSYLSEHLLSLGYNVLGVIRRHSVSETQTCRLNHLMANPEFNLCYGDLSDYAAMQRIIKEYMPDEIYNLAAQSHVKVSFDIPLYTANATGVGLLNILEIIRQDKQLKHIKVYQASSSEMFGNCIDEDGYQRETTTMQPVSPYGCSKLFAHNIARNYRNSYNIFVSCGILFNHESPRRGLNFVTAKVAKGVADIYNGKADKLVLGNLESSRDWGHAKDYVKAMQSILAYDKPDDFVCATGNTYTIRQLCDISFGLFDMDYRDYVVTDKIYERPEELHLLKGDYTKLKDTLGFEHTYTLNSMMEEMINHYI